MNYKIIRNSAKCLRCEDEIESTYRWDYVSCSCGALSVDGGHSYLRRGFKEGVPYEDTSITEPIDISE